MSEKDPSFQDSIEELAEFWDSHDLVEFTDQLEEVADPVFERKREGDRSKVLAKPLQAHSGIDFDDIQGLLDKLNSGY